METKQKHLNNFMFDVFGILGSLPGINVTYNKTTKRFLLQYKFYVLDFSFTLDEIYFSLQVYDAKTREVITIIRNHQE